MDWKLFFSTFLLVFLAELGDKTQIAIVLTSSSSGKFWETFLGGASALILTTLIAVILGEFINKTVPFNIVKILAGILFIGMGFLILLK